MAKMKKYDSAQAYFADQTEEAQKALEEMKAIILEVVPEAEERITYSIPAYALIPGGNIKQQVMMASYKNHISLYPHPEVLEVFRDELADYEVKKGTLQIKYSQKIPKALIKKMITYRLNQIEK